MVRKWKSTEVERTLRTIAVFTRKNIQRYEAVTCFIFIKR